MTRVGFSKADAAGRLVAAIKAEAARRIETCYPLWKQINIAREGGAAAEEMARFIDAIRAASNALEADPPADFTAEQHWPTSN